MADQELLSTQPAEGVPGQTPESQGSAPASQDAGQNQNAGSQDGRPDDTDASSNGTGEKPSYYYENRRLNSTVRQMQQTMQQMQQQQQELLQRFQQPSAPQPSNQPAWKDPNTIFAKPVETLEELRQSILQELTGKTKETYQQLNQQGELQRQMQEAGNLLLTNEAIRKNPRGREIIEDILADPEYGLNAFSQTNPKAAANLALAIYNSKINGGAGQTRNPAAPTRGQMVSTTTGGVPGGGQLSIQAEFDRLNQELQTDPQRKSIDPEFMARFNKVRTAWQQKIISGS